MSRLFRTGPTGDELGYTETVRPTINGPLARTQSVTAPQDMTRRVGYAGNEGAMFTSDIVTPQLGMTPIHILPIERKEFGP